MRICPFGAGIFSNNPINLSKLDFKIRGRMDGLFVTADETFVGGFTTLSLKETGCPVIEDTSEHIKLIAEGRDCRFRVNPEEFGGVIGYCTIPKSGNRLLLCVSSAETFTEDSSEYAPLFQEYRRLIQEARKCD